MKSPLISRTRRGFTLMETVIAIGVLALLLTGFLAVFAPATAGIRKAVSIQEADRLAFALQKELVLLRGDNPTQNTGFEKAYDWIKGSTTNNTALLVYQYRSVIDGSLRSDGTPEPYTSAGGVAGEDFIVQPMVRQKSDPELKSDLQALEGRVYAAKLVQLVFNSNGELERGAEGKITSPTGGAGGTSAETYPEAVIAFAAEFHLLPNSAHGYITGSQFNLTKLNQPVFTRNLAVRR
ncbi:prepilin-type N-terminal cleavage/methylation domain-containing protein [Haloferula chungangensis]|uniref:Prepilin-type N-terminal cleavage/methylation domain-containing protein n=1 Tax=Haloferula chungangensis TaxID=1048331 RepID=A0ABW2L6C4_9BACT